MCPISRGSMSIFASSYVLKDLRALQELRQDPAS